MKCFIFVECKICEYATRHGQKLVECSGFPNFSVGRVQAHTMSCHACPLFSAFFILVHAVAMNNISRLKYVCGSLYTKPL